MEYKYNFINRHGQIVSTNNLSTIKNGLTWGMLHYLPKLDYRMTKEENEFFKRYSLYPSVWNFQVFRYLGMVYLYPLDLKRLKGGT